MAFDYLILTLIPFAATVAAWCWLRLDSLAGRLVWALGVAVSWSALVLAGGVALSNLTNLVTYEGPRTFPGALGAVLVLAFVTMVPISAALPWRSPLLAPGVPPAASGL